eukprot:31566-Pelagococcus_subviridis.AAC.17
MDSASGTATPTTASIAHRAGSNPRSPASVPVRCGGGDDIPGSSGRASPYSGDASIASSRNRSTSERFASSAGRRSRMFSSSRRPKSDLLRSVRPTIGNAARTSAAFSNFWTTPTPPRMPKVT